MLTYLHIILIAIAVKQTKFNVLLLMQRENWLRVMFFLVINTYTYTHDSEILGLHAVSVKYILFYKDLKGALAYTVGYYFKIDSNVLNSTIIKTNNFENHPSFKGRMRAGRNK